MSTSIWRSFRCWAACWRTARSGEILAEGVTRFRDPASARAPRRPFPGYAAPPEVLGEAGEPPAPLRFASVNDLHLLCVRMEADFYGLGMHAGPLRLNGRTLTCWNTDAWGYDDHSPSLYQSHPWVLALSAEGRALGLLVETTERCHFRFGRGIECISEGGYAPPVVVIEGQSPEQVLERLARLTGHMPLPPRWALGYHQCRYSYETAARAREVARELRRRSIPCDAIWLDIDSMHGFRCFRFDPKTFPNPAQLTGELRAEGFQTVWMVDPGIKVEPGDEVYDAGRPFFVRGSDGKELHGKVWPGLCAFPDFTSAPARRWWAGLQPMALSTGVAGLWNDMNEPAIFEAPGKTMDPLARHRADADLGGPGPHSRYHNIYGMQMVRATRAGMLDARPDRRPFVLSRANFIGGHRDAAAWTGDNTSDWRHLAWSTSMALNLGLSGQPFAGPDIGGFSGNADASLFARWMGIGALLPLARGHSEKGTRDHEPWSFGPECERTCRLALQRRMRLMPYLYSAFEESSRTGLPVVRPLFMVDPRDPALRDRSDAFLLGRDVLVECDLNRAGAGPRAARPDWPSFEPVEADANLPRLRARPGSIIPLGPVMDFTGQRPCDPLTLLVTPDDAGIARGTLYEDAGDGFGFQRGEFRRIELTWVAGSPFTQRVAAGNWPLPQREVEVVVLDAPVRPAASAGASGGQSTRALV